MSTTHDDARRYYALCDRARQLGIDTDLNGDESRTVAQLEAEVAAASIVAALESLPADPAEAMLDLHGILVSLPGYAEGENLLLDAVLTRLERRMSARRGHSMRR